jgi:hypothetical protein
MYGGLMGASCCRIHYLLHVFRWLAQLLVNVGRVHAESPLNGQILEPTPILGG